MNGSVVKKIDSLQALRALACLCVFLNHCQFPHVALWSVTVFLMLSGYVLTLSSLSKPAIEAPTLKSAFRFSARKIGKLYALHVITLFPYLVLELYKMRCGLSGSTISGLGKSLIVYLTLTNSWIPDANKFFPFNGVTWYLSTISFSYFVFPFVLWRLRRTDGRTAAVWLILLTVLEFATASFYKPLSSLFTSLPFFPDSNASLLWFFQKFPPFRALDFLIGCCLALIVRDYGEKLTKAGAWLLDIAAIVFFIFSVAVFRGHGPMSVVSFMRGVIYVPFAIAVIASFAINKGLSPRLFTNRFTVFFGNISAVFYMIHQCFTDYSFFILETFFQYSFMVDIAVTTVVAFVLSLLSSVLWQKLTGIKKSKV